MYRKSYCTTLGISIGTGLGGRGVNKMLKFYVEVLYVMGKAVSGELSCTLTGLVLLQNLVMLAPVFRINLMHSS